jgi:hypothetical protein
MNQSVPAQRIRAQFILQQARQTTLDFDVAMQDGDTRAGSESVRHIQRVLRTLTHFLAQCDGIPDVAADVEEVEKARNELHQRLGVVPAGLGEANVEH